MAGAVMKKEETPKDIKERCKEWLKSKGTGASAQCIYDFFATGYVVFCSYPHDADDFGRCLKLLEVVPEWEARLSELSEIEGVHGEVWAKLAEEWEVLKNIRTTAPDKVSEYMNSIIKPIEKRSDEVGVINKGCTVSVSKSHQRDGDNSTPGVGHNSGPKDTGGIGGQRLLSFIERIERLEEEKAALMEDLKEVYAEAKGVGFDVKTIRKIVSLRKMDSEKRREANDLLDLYASAIGMQGVLL